MDGPEIVDFVVRRPANDAGQPIDNAPNPRPEKVRHAARSVIVNDNRAPLWRRKAARGFAMFASALVVGAGFFYFKR